MAEDEFPARGGNNKNNSCQCLGKAGRKMWKNNRKLQNKGIKQNRKEMLKRYENPPCWQILNIIIIAVAVATLIFTCTHTHKNTQKQQHSIVIFLTESISLQNQGNFTNFSQLFEIIAAGE